MGLFGLAVTTPQFDRPRNILRVRCLSFFTVSVAQNDQVAAVLKTKYPQGTLDKLPNPFRCAGFMKQLGRQQRPATVSVAFEKRTKPFRGSLQVRRLVPQKVENGAGFMTFVAFQTGDYLVLTLFEYHQFHKT